MDALLSAGVVFINAMVSSVQEIQAKRQLDQIALLNRPQALVVRDGEEQFIAPEAVVRGDMLKVSAGDQIIVDGSVVGDGRAELDESQVTGEADRIAKVAGDPVFSGSYCVAGSLCYVAEKVGAASLANQITAGAKQDKRELTPLQHQINMLVRVFLLVIIFMEIVLVMNAFVQTRSLVESVQDVTAAAGLIPNGLFLSITVAYVISALRIVRFGVLVQRSNAIESLSNIDTLCVDKTGTLTANRLQLHGLAPLGLSEAEFEHILGEMMASTTTGNKTSEALATAFPREPRPLQAEVPFSSARKWSAVAFDDSARHGIYVMGQDAVRQIAGSTLDGAARRGIYVLGAAEMLRPYLPDEHDPPWQAQLKAWSDQGLRVLLAGHHADPTLLRDEGDATTLPPLSVIGLVSLSDELRPEAAETLARFRAAGVQPKIISGDNPETVAALARQAGLPADIKLVSGPELEQLDEAAFAQAAEEATILEALGLPKLQVLANLDGIAGLERRPGSVRTFASALQCGLEAFLSDTQGSPAQGHDSAHHVVRSDPTSFGLGSDPTGAQISEVLRAIVAGDRDALVVLLTPATIVQPEGRFLPEYGESIEEHWVFRIIIPSAWPMLQWSIVDLCNKHPAYSYAFN